MKNDVILNNFSVIDRCINRVQDVYANDAGILKDFTKHNIQRACEASIDLAMHIVAEQRLGIASNQQRCV